MVLATTTMRNRPDKPLAIRNGLKVYTKLKAKKAMRIITPKQKAKNKSWSEITNEHIATLQGICQWCGLPGQRTGWNFLSGHHIVKRRYNIHTMENNYIAHYHTCHQEIEDNAIDVRIYPDRKAWEAETNVSKAFQMG